MKILSGPGPSRQMTLTKFYPSDKVTVTMTAQTFVDGLVSMVADDGIPLRFFGSSAWK
jgi:hypothetical protein